MTAASQTAVNVLAILTPQATHVADVEALLGRMALASRQEPGCLRYDILREDHADGPRFHIQERYQDAEAVTAHGASEHYAAFRAQVGPWLVAPPQVTRLADVNVAPQG
ncbi:putative quinol monooxygenase [Deinococcus gobiensis]|uniref:Putative dehydrogenase, monooxygenase subunit n=1 Tax=Deinococcus gobiensis (strain DSM 21396 / JCM 16679 / CGMCC 1.7299 / I-0) TaxID=745776 RepID=H8GYG9_DEIGI|nr:putative quinol monooxygenase [Deinococcus gobiensis]AFD24822.1 Putative dehydrogenase, monooxygenase subunit [Deinococcus gobiensis I-0]